ncbi:signal transduction histidine kinase [Xenococcus sp. PCC 7305]|uniref:GAF domain-containing sensor histidine kinase n=1 Tax=Xenococcus sp. PCC 7305 TaxID=102125 RepID=UPI0002AC1D23|nr:sensor histidine kinase [Xenococcus sp. PCC 7305]ELS04848.1 signal transduction histidine kinase [Xenococcus sp. PCC 7305]
MSHSYAVASAEFTTLCESQIRLLTQSLGAIWSVVYLTEEQIDSPETNLLPFFVYPQNKLNLPQQLPGQDFPAIWRQVTSLNNNASILLPELAIADNHESSQLAEINLATKKLIVPLIYEDVALGLLVTRREDRNWTKIELQQVEDIAQSLAIARFLERQSQWYREQLSKQENLFNWEQDRTDDLLHQLRNPLTALRTFSKLLLKRFVSNSREHSIADSILRESDHLANLLQQFEAELEQETAETLPLTLSTTSVRLAEEQANTQTNFLLPGKNDLDIVSLPNILNPLLISAKAIAKAKKIELASKIPDSLPQVYGEAKALTEIFNNLIDNAIKYTPSSGQVNIAIAIKSELLGVLISDTGYGIPLQDQEHIFERHYRGVQAEGEIPGTGLGLAIAKKLVMQMQGKIELISPNNLSKDPQLPGTTFIVWLKTVKSKH